MPREFVCHDCGKTFALADGILARYPGWTPRQCLTCREGGSAGPETGVFTDGACEPNPGSGGWGAVKVIAGEIAEERHGSEEATTNNRMELKALIEGYKMLGQNEDLAVYSDSELCVNTITKWAPTWERKGWKKKGGEIKNLDLVKELYELARSHPRTRLQWIRGHSGTRWNEYADALSRVQRTEGISGG